MKELFYGAVAVVFFTVVMYIGFMVSTTKSSWYANMHDSQHEGANCHCYERFMERNGK